MCFSVLIPIYHKENPLFFRQALKSIWDDQTLKPTEILIVKDGPLTQELDRVVDDFSRMAPVKMLELKEQQGLGVALNEGLKACTYALVARMDSDDVARSDRFEIQLRFIKENPQYDVVSSNIAEFNDSVNEWVSYRRLPEYPEQIERFSKRRCPLNHMAVVFRKEAVLNAGNYQPCFGYEDYFLWVRMLQKGSVFYNIQDYLISARIGNGMLSRRRGRMFFREEVRFQKELLRMGFITPWVYVSNLFFRVIPPLFPLWTLKYIYKLIRLERRW